MTDWKKDATERLVARPTDKLQEELEQVEHNILVVEEERDKVWADVDWLKSKNKELEAEVERLKVLLGRAATILTEETPKCDGS